MFFSLATIAVVALLPDAVLGGPIQKRLTNQVIRSYRTNSCLTLQGGVQIVDGSLLKFGDCSTATRWDISPGSGSVIVSGTNFALDAGVPQQNFNLGKVWTSYPTSPQQTWFLTGDNRIAVTGGNQCLDAGDNGPQTYQCTTGNTNQIFYVEAPPPITSSTSSSSASSTSSSASSTSTPVPPPTATARQLQWKTNPSSCVTVSGTAADVANGTPVTLSRCFNPTSPSSGGQLWNFLSNGLIQLTGTNYCLDAGVNPSNGVGMKVWQCYPGLAQQSWTFPAAGGLFQTANSQCLDVDNSNYTRMQTWACSSPDPNQQFIQGPAY